MKIKESQLRKIIQESLKELDWKTYANAAKKAQEWRNENPFKYDRNRGMHFDSAAQKKFNQQHGIENLPDYGGENGNINFSSFHGEPEISGSRNHDFGDGGGPFNLSHTVYHMGKQYGKDGGYGRTRMWDHPHETTPEDFYGDEETAKKFRDAEQDVDNFRNGNYEYTPDKGWHLKEFKLNKIIKESIKKCLNEAYDIDDGTYYGGGMPEPAQHAMTYTPEKEVAEICEQMRPYVDKLADIFNSYSPTVQGVDDKVFTLLNGFDELPKLAKFFSTTEID